MTMQGQTMRKHKGKRVKENGRQAHMNRLRDGNVTAAPSREDIDAGTKALDALLKERGVR